MNPIILEETNSSIEFNPKFAQAYDLLENSPRSLFITGKAGTGKSTLLKYFREHTTKKLAILAPTGVAAVNIKGQTIHSFFCFKPDITPDTVANIRLRRDQAKIYRNVEAILIDEISMVRADLLDCMDTFLRLHGRHHDRPFGGIQMIFIGDLFQLPPVVTRQEMNIFRQHYPSPYFFDAKAFPTLDVEFIELNKIYRQQEQEFIELLGAVRNKTVSDRDMARLNERHLPGFVPKADAFTIFLTTTNKLADGINHEQVSKLKSRSYMCEGEISGDFERRSLPTHMKLELKIGAQVMLLNNDPNGRWINGSIGKITYLNEEGFGTDAIEVELADGEIVEVLPYTWEMFQFSLNADTESLESESIGAFRQYPLRLAWAVTIHKSQGKTFSDVVIDIGTGTFSHGQTYVALSRCTRFDGLVLRKPLRKHHILLESKGCEIYAKYYSQGVPKMKRSVIVCLMLVILMACFLLKNDRDFQAEAKDGVLVSRKKGESMSVYNVEKGSFENVQMPQKSKEEWKKELKKIEYKVAFEEGTELPFTGKLNGNKKKGVYRSKISGVDLFHSDHKFNSGTGWPSFFKPVHGDNLEYIEDVSLGMTRVEVRDKVSGAHLGHVFSDGPEPTGKRYCINSAALEFVESVEYKEPNEESKQ